MAKISLPASQFGNDFCPQTLFLYGTYKEDGTPNFGLFCWFSYIWDGELGVMACIGEDKLTRDRIRAAKVFSANIVTEKLLPLADLLGNTAGYSAEKAKIPVKTAEGTALHVPVLADSPWSFELEAYRSFMLDSGEVFLCKIRGIQAEESLLDKNISLDGRMRSDPPVHYAYNSYFSWDGKLIGTAGSLKDKTVLF